MAPWRKIQDPDSLSSQTDPRFVAFSFVSWTTPHESKAVLA